MRKKNRFQSTIKMTVSLLFFFFWYPWTWILTVWNLDSGAGLVGEGRGDLCKKKPDSSDSRGESPKFKILSPSPLFSLCNFVVMSSEAVVGACSTTLRDGNFTVQLTNPIAFLLLFSDFVQFGFRADTVSEMCD